MTITSNGQFKHWKGKTPLNRPRLSFPSRPSGYKQMPNSSVAIWRDSYQIMNTSQSSSAFGCMFLPGLMLKAGLITKRPRNSIKMSTRLSVQLAKHTG